MNTHEMNHKILDSVLLDFRIESVNAPNPAMLEAYCRRYPQYVKELTDYAVQWLIEDAIDATTTNDEVLQNTSSALVSRAISRFHDRVASRTGSLEIEAGNESCNPFAGLSIQHKREIRDQLGIDTPLLAKFQNRLIDPDTVPNRFLKRMAEVLKLTAVALIGYLQGPPKLHTEADYKSENKPSVSLQKESFEEAVRKSSLDVKQKQELLRD